MADDKEEHVVENTDAHFEPLVSLQPVEIATLEEDEDEMLKLRARLFRFDTTAEPPEWKERGTGDVKILRDKTSGTCRVLMRRDKTHNICANHNVLPYMELKPNCGSDRAWVWIAHADFADGEAKPEHLAIMFPNAENARKFKTKFEEAKEIMGNIKEKLNGKSEAVSKEENVSPKEENVSPKEDNVSPKKEQHDLSAQSSQQEDSKNEVTDEVTDKLEGLTVEDGQKGGSGDSKDSDNVNTSVDSDNQAER